MAFRTSIEHLDRLIREAIEEQPDVRAAVTDLGLAPDDLVALVSGNREEIWRVAAEEVDQFNSAEAHLEKALEQVKHETPAVPRVLAVARVLGPMLPGSALLIYVISGFIAGFKTFPKFLLTPTGAFIAGGVLIVIAMVAGWNYLFTRNQLATEEEWRKRLSIPEIEATRVGGLAAIDSAVKARGIQPRLRELLNEILQWKWSERLQVYRGAGLGEVDSTDFEIATDARHRVESLLRQMPGGCIGLAGPRGAGKTTVLSYVCSARVAAPHPPKTVLAVKTSAPVQYEVREFVLHLYSLICQAVLNVHNAEETPPAAEAAPMSPRTASTMRRLASVFLSSALALLLFAAFVATQIVESSKIATPAQNATAAAPKTFLDAFEVKPGSFALAAAALMIAGIGLLIVAGKNAPPLTFNVFGRSFRLRTRPEEPASGEPEIVQIARDRLEEIRFQYSYSSGWGGTLKLPIGLDLQRSSSRTLARQQRTLPEIVASYVQFVKMLTSDYTVIVGIDELDKMESADKVHVFLNQTKALFGIPGCFYVLSVSENAIASFERRGLPLRDVLDSTFDTIVDVSYLTFEQSQQLLNKRVIGLSVPFVAVCHVLSGGLPRDLIRTCRDLLDISTPPGPAELRPLVARLVAVEVSRKARALSVVVRDRTLDAATDVLNLLRTAETMPLDDGAAIIAEAQKLKTQADALAAVTPHENDAEEHDQVVALAREAAAFFYFAGTVEETFSARSVGEWIAPPLQRVDQLAVARRSFAVRPAVAERAVTDFRRTVGLPLIPTWQ